MKIRFSNRLGLLTLIGVVAGAVLAGLAYPMNPYLAIPFVLLAIVSFILFCIYLYKFVFYSPELDLPDEEQAEEKE
ncbi:hypothetical protein [Methanocella arvoryzae]|uniref:hypothetical protein n=1 Tax=Methanocella arvoryzae TaxID=1175445 RepID=UPI0003230706|nr:hypothetical protein [Methanocella arvoryzae]